jgi:hypothetical protein
MDAGNEGTGGKSKLASAFDGASTALLSTIASTMLSPPMGSSSSTNVDTVFTVGVGICTISKCLQHPMSES